MEIVCQLIFYPFFFFEQLIEIGATIDYITIH